MSVLVQEKTIADGTKLGEYAAMQPVSGVQYVGAPAISGSGNGKFIRISESKKSTQASN